MDVLYKEKFLINYLISLSILTRLESFSCLPVFKIRSWLFTPSRDNQGREVFIVPGDFSAMNLNTFDVL